MTTPQFRDQLRCWRSHVTGVALAAAIAATTTGPGPAVSAQMPSAQSVPAKSGRLSNYSFDTIYEVRAGAAPSFDHYWSALRDLPPSVAPSLRRYVDGTADGTRRIVSLPVVRLAEYGSDRHNEEALRAGLGEPLALQVQTAFSDAQVVRNSYIRQYRADLSANREHHGRAPQTEWTFVTVASQRENEFEKVWHRAVEAYRRARGLYVRTVARTLVGGGPQYVITRPIPQTGEDQGLEPVDAVRLVYGERAAVEFAAQLQPLIVEWHTETLMNLGLDAAGAAGAP